MTRQDFEIELSSLGEDINTYVNTMQTSYSDFVLPNKTRNAADLYPIILSQNWASLINTSQSRLTSIQTQMDQILVEQSEINNLFNRFVSLKSGFKNFHREPQNLPDWPQIRDLFQDEFDNQNVPQNIAQNYINRIGGTGGLHLYNYIVKRFNALSEYLNFIYERNLAHYMFYLQSTKLSEFNNLAQTQVSLQYNVSTRIRALRNSIAGRSETIFNKIKSKDISQLESRISSLQTWLDNKFTAEIIPILVHCHQERLSSGSSVYYDGNRAMKAGCLFREAMFAQAQILWLAWITGWARTLKSPSELFSNSQALEFEPSEPHYPTVSIKDLMLQSAVFDNTNIVIKGVIQSINITHLSPTKVLSTAILTDGHGRSLELALPYIKLDSGGIVNDSYVAITGRFLMQNPETNDSPGLSIGRLDVKDRASSSWSAYMMYSLRNIYQKIAHNLSANFSAEIGRDGVVNSLKYDTTYVSPKIPNFDLGE